MLLASNADISQFDGGQRAKRQQDILILADPPLSRSPGMRIRVG